MNKHEINMPDGTKAFAPAGDAQDHQAVIDARHKIVVAYCTSKGWPTDAGVLTFDQIMEIRSQPEWKDAGKR